ncbi:MAG: AMP-binding protein [Haloarculaceae archaeon]
MTIHEHGGRPYEWVGALSERRATLSPDRVGVLDADEEREYTYAELDRRANRAARLLRDQGVGTGDRVAVVSRNRVDLVDLYFATGKTGAILAPLSHRLAPAEIAEMLADVDPALVVVEQPFVDEVADALDRVEDSDAVPTVLVIPDREGDQDSAEAEGESRDDGLAVGGQTDGDGGPGWDLLPSILPEADSPVATAGVALSDPHLFLHTGGSTGLPKEVVQTHGGIMWNAFNTILSWGLRPDDVTPMVFPMFHTGGWNVLTIPLFHLGGTVILSRDFDPGQVLRLVEAEEASVLVGVPAVLRFMVEDEAWESTDLSSLRFAKSGGGPCREGIIDAWSDRGIDLSQGYGLTECGPNNFAMPDDWDREKTHSIGMPGLYVDARIVDEDGEVLPPDTVGELELASPHAANRYWRNPEETAETFGDGSLGRVEDGRRGDETESGEDGDWNWVSTEDLARVDEEGYYYIEGRKKNMFVSGGENVYPPEVEDVLTDHPTVEEAIIVPVPDETWGEVGKAVVEGDESLTLQELQEFAEDRLAGFKIPKHLAFVDEMPIGGAGKIQRQDVEAEFGGTAAGE